MGSAFPQRPRPVWSGTCKCTVQFDDGRGYTLMVAGVTISVKGKAMRAILRNVDPTHPLLVEKEQKS